MLFPPHIPPFFFLNDTATTEIYTLSLHDALPIYLLGARSPEGCDLLPFWSESYAVLGLRRGLHARSLSRSEEHTSELQSHSDLVCRLLLEKKNNCPNSTFP